MTSGTGTPHPPPHGAPDASPDLSRPHHAGAVSEEERVALEGHAAAHALHALTSEEGAAYEAHLARCAYCRVLIASFAAVVDVLPLAVEPAPPNPALKAGLLAAVRADLPAGGGGAR
jgi:hypothetical protein